MNRENIAATSAQPTTLALQALNDGKLAGSWTLDPERSEIRFRTTVMWGLLPIKGAFRKVSGNAVITPAGEVSGTVTLNAGSIDTDNRRRDEHLRSASFLEAGEYPDIVFAADQVTARDDGVTLAGSLTVHGRTRPVSVQAQVSGLGDDEVRIEGEAQVDRAEFGLTWSPLGMASMSNVVTVQAVFTRREPAGD